MRPGRSRRWPPSGPRRCGWRGPRCTVASEPILNGLLPDIFAKSERGKAYGLVRGIGGGVGIVMGPAIGMFGANPDGWLRERNYYNNAASVRLRLTRAGGVPGVTVLRSCEDAERC